MEDNKDKRMDASGDQDAALTFFRESARPSSVAPVNRIPNRPTGQNNANAKAVPPARNVGNQAPKTLPQNNRQPQYISGKPMQAQAAPPAPKRPLHSLREVEKTVQPQTSLLQQKPMQAQNSKNEQNIVPLPNRKTAPTNASEVRKNNLQASPQNPQKTLQHPPNNNALDKSNPARAKTPPSQNPAEASQLPQKRSQVKPIQTKNGSVSAPGSGIQPQPKKRTENDDFEIDEITYTKETKRVKRDSEFTDSATSAVMSLVKAVVYIVAIIAVSVGLAVFIINTGNDIFKFTSDEKIVTVNIPEYATIDDVADALYDAGAIKHKWAFKMWSNLKTKGKTLEFAAGTYELSTSLNYDYLRMAFRKNTGSYEEVRITIPEGYTVDEIIELFVSKGIGTKEGFVDAIQNYEFDYPFLDGLTVSPDRIYRLEGYLFPDTYNFYKNSSEVTVLKKLLDNFNNKFVEAYYARCDQLGITVDEAIILASIVEKETRYADELGFVSSVFHNRLKYSATYPYLNSDATIMYAMQHDLGGRPDSMSGEDTDYETPYNTYTHKGLPPGPIANPGLNSIKYALYPNESNYFYMVSDSSGRTLFAETEKDHLANINIARGN